MKERIKLDDVPYGDYYHIIYHLEYDNNHEGYLYVNVNPQIDKNGKYYEITFRDMMNEIEKKHNKKISHFIMLAESGLDGVVYRYDCSVEGKEIYEWGTTRGYA